MIRAANGLNVAVKPMAHNHLGQIVAIENTSFNSPWPETIFRAYIQNKSTIALVSVNLPGKFLTGYLCLWLQKEIVQVQNLAIHPAFRKQGIGRHLLTEGLKQAMAKGAGYATLEVRPSNFSARRLYESLNFIQIGVKPDYYKEEGEDALLMACKLG